MHNVMSFTVSGTCLRQGRRPLRGEGAGHGPEHDLAGSYIYIYIHIYIYTHIYIYIYIHTCNYIVHTIGLELNHKRYDLMYPPAILVDGQRLEYDPNEAIELLTS